MHTARGLGGHIFILDEAGFTPAAVIWDIILVGWLGSGINTAAIISSSIGPSGNHFTELVREAARTKDTADEMVELVVQTLVCDRCKERGGDAPLKCTHMYHMIPSWHDKGRTEIAHRIAASNPASVLQEQKNFVGGGGGNVFDSRLVARLLTDHGTTVPRSSIERPMLGAIVIDPSTSGECDTSVTLVARFHGALLVCGLALRCTRGTSSYKEFLREVDAAILADSWLRGCRWVVFPENNTGFAGGVTQETLSDRARYYHPILAGEDPGICTSTHNKASYAHSLNAYLDSDQIRLLRNFIIVHGVPEKAQRPDPQQYRLLITDKIATQLNNCCWKTTTNARTGINARGGWTGKSNNTEDDGAITLAISAEIDRKWGRKRATAKGIVDSYITANIPSNIVDSWGRTVPMS